MGADCKRPLVVILFTFKAGELSGCSPLLGAWHSKHTTAGLIPRERSDQFLKGSEKVSGCYVTCWLLRGALESPGTAVSKNMLSFHDS